MTFRSLIVKNNQMANLKIRKYRFVIAKPNVKKYIYPSFKTEKNSGTLIKKSSTIKPHLNSQ